MALATTTIAIIGLAATAASTAGALYAADTQANQQEASAKFAADQAAADAKAETASAQIEADRIRAMAKKQKSSALAAAAASGVDVNSGSVIKISEDIDNIAGQDAYMTLVGGEDAAARLNQQASASRIAGRSARSAGRAAQATSLISGVSTASGYGRNWKRAG